MRPQRASGAYECSFMPQQAGRAAVLVQLRGEGVGGSPFFVAIGAGPTAAAQVRARARGTAQAEPQLIKPRRSPNPNPNPNPNPSPTPTLTPTPTPTPTLSLSLSLTLTLTLTHGRLAVLASHDRRCAAADRWTAPAADLARR